MDPRTRQRLTWWAAAALCALPLALAAADLALGRLGANPIEAAQHRLGFWTLTFLAASLAPTPLHAVAGLAWPLRLRRLLGLTAFGYAALHFLWYLVVDQTLDVGLVAVDVVKRPFITVGFAALLILLPLALTSTDGWVKRLGFKAWKRLHRLVYLAALLGVVHFVWRVKADRLKPAIFAAIIGALLLARLLPRSWQRRREPAAVRRAA
jgi:sulfoxide reductase heme-binding subunit YedZ